MFDRIILSCDSLSIYTDVLISLSSELLSCCCHGNKNIHSTTFVLTLLCSPLVSSPDELAVVGE